METAFGLALVAFAVLLLGWVWVRSVRRARILERLAKQNDDMGEEPLEIDDRLGQISGVTGS